ncbi:MAG: group III truncated hemoglobin [Hyphomicrobiaceae bacterium]|nr:group III truncated hemoglobin [Hyphomicrobiaceae bacterium]
MPPHPRAPGLEVGITEPMIRDLVGTFYARVRQDSLLGPIFNAEVEDWGDHLARLCAFWSSVTLMTGRYKGKPVPAHARLPGISNRHFAHWLALFAETALEVCPPAAAGLFIDRSQRIAQSLQLAIALDRGEGIEARHDAA